MLHLHPSDYLKSYWLKLLNTNAESTRLTLLELIYMPKWTGLCLSNCLQHGQNTSLNMHNGLVFHSDLTSLAMAS